MIRKPIAEVVLLLIVTGAAFSAAPGGKFYFEPGAAISQTNPAAIIKVTAVGRTDLYDTVESQGDLNFHVKVRGSCDDGWKVGSATVKIKGKVHQLDVNKTLGSIGFDNGEKWSFQVATFPYLTPDTQSPPVAMCNAEVERRLARGDSRTEILSKGFDLTVPNAYFAELSVACLRKKNGFLESYHPYADTKLPVTISCQPTDYKVVRTPGTPKRTPGTPLRTPVPERPIDSVDLVADPLATTGRQCPVYVNFRGEIRPGENSAYQKFNTKYRFVGDRGYETPWTFVTINQGETRTINGRRFIEAPIDPGRTLSPSEKARIPLYRGWTELEVQLPNGSIRSERANFTVDCNVTPARPRIKASTTESLPNPQLDFAGREPYDVNGERGTRFKLSVTNRASHPDFLWYPSRNLPPCGENENASRTWVEIFGSPGDERLAGFCRLRSSEDLGQLWYAIPDGEKGPPCVYIVMTDRQTGQKYESNRKCSRLLSVVSGTIKGSGDVKRVKRAKEKWIDLESTQ